MTGVLSRSQVKLDCWLVFMGWFRRGLSRMRWKAHVRFLGEGRLAITFPYPTPFGGRWFVIYWNGPNKSTKPFTCLARKPKSCSPHIADLAGATTGFRKLWGRNVTLMQTWIMACFIWPIRGLPKQDGHGSAISDCIHLKRLSWIIAGFCRT